MTITCFIGTVFAKLDVMPEIEMIFVISTGHIASIIS